MRGSRAAYVLSRSGVRPFHTCYPSGLTRNITRDVALYLNQPKIRSLIGVDSALDSYNYTAYAFKVNEEFTRSLDTIQTTNQYVASLLEHGIKVLIYVGKNDYICNHVGNAKWLSELEWSGKNGFGDKPLKDWYMRGYHIENGFDQLGFPPGTPGPLVSSGSFKSYGGLTFLTIDGGAHMVSARWMLSFTTLNSTFQVPYNRPAESLWMVNRWLSGNSEF